MKKQAFTLVELIVVITILAILGTIGFISLQGFSGDARDSKRISEVSEIRNGLQIYQARNSLLPTPSEQIVTIGSGTTDLIIQGYAGESVLNEIRMNGNPKDPLENEHYIYSVNENKTKFQLLTLLENDNSLISFNKLNIIPTTHASYTNRYLYTLGQNVGILLEETTNRPIQKLATSVDLQSDNSNYRVIFSDNNESSILNGSLLYDKIITKRSNNRTTNVESENYTFIFSGICPTGWIDLGNVTAEFGRDPITFNNNYKICRGNMLFDNYYEVISTSCPTLGGSSYSGDVTAEFGRDPITFNNNYVICNLNNYSYLGLAISTICPTGWTDLGDVVAEFGRDAITLNNNYKICEKN